MVALKIGLDLFGSSEYNSVIGSLLALNTPVRTNNPRKPYNSIKENVVKYFFPTPFP